MELKCGDGDCLGRVEPVPGSASFEDSTEKFICRKCGIIVLIKTPKLEEPRRTYDLAVSALTGRKR